MSWGTACQTKFKKIKISHIAFTASSLHTKEIMQHFTLFEILTLENIFKLKIGSLVHNVWFNSTCYHPPPPPPGKTQPVWPGGREFPQAILPGCRGVGQIEITTRARTYGVTQRRLLEPRGKGHFFRFSHFVNLQSES